MCEENTYDERKPFSHVNSKGVRYYLNKKDVELRGGKRTSIHYFTKELRPEAIYELPDDLEIQENPRNGFLTVRRVERDCGRCECDEGCEEEAGDRIRDSFDKEAVANDILRKLKEAEKSMKPLVKRRVLAEELKSVGEVGNIGETDTIVVEYDYSQDVMREFRDSDRPTRIRIGKNMSMHLGEARQFTKAQLKAHIQNLQDVLDRL